MTRQQKIVLSVGIIGLLGCCAVVSVTWLMLAARVFPAFSDAALETSRLEENETEALASERGLLVTAVDPNGRAAAAGIRRGDIILSVDGVDTDRISTLRRLLGAREPGDRLEVLVRRGDRREELVVVLGDGGRELGIHVMAAQDATAGPDTPIRPPGSAPDRPDSPIPFPERPDILPPESPFEITPAIPQIGGIIDGGPAEAAGLEEGDLIARIDSQLILSQADLLEQLGRHAPGDQVEVTVRRGREILSFMVRLGRHPDDQTRAYLGIELGSPFLHPPIDPSRVPDLDG